MDVTVGTTEVRTSPGKTRDIRRVFGIAATTLAFALAGALVAIRVGDGAVEAPGGLSAHQIVIRGELADRAPARRTDLSPEQIVIRGEVAARGAETPDGLSPEQIVIRAEVADRLDP